MHATIAYPPWYYYAGVTAIIVCAIIIVTVNAYYVLQFRPRLSKLRKYREQSKYSM